MLLRNRVLALGGVAAVLALPDLSHDNSDAGQEYSFRALGQEPLHYQTINHPPPQSIRSETIYQILSSAEEYV